MMQSSSTTWEIIDKEQSFLKEAQAQARKIESNMQTSKRSNLPNFTMDDSSKTNKLENKAVCTENNELSIVPLEELAEMINIMEANHANQLSIMQDHLIQEEKSSINTFQP